MAESVNDQIEIRKTILVVETPGPGVSSPDAEGGCRRLSPEGIVVVQYHRTAAAALVQNDAPHALLLSTAGTSANSLFYGGCALVTEPAPGPPGSAPDSQVLYSTSNLLQTTDSAQLPVVLITRIVLRHSAAGQIASVLWTKLRAPPAMPIPAAMIPYHVAGDSGVLYCAQGNMAPGSSGLFFMPRGKRPQTVVNSYYGRELNSVRDVAAHPHDGSLWFVDPHSGFDQDFRNRPQLPCHIYRIGVDPRNRDIRVMADGLGQPTSLCFDPAGSTLYVSDTSSTADGVRRATICAYDIVRRGDADFVANRRVFAYALRGAPMCVRCDAEGNVFAACDTGVEIWSPGGSLLAIIDVPGPSGVSSFCFTSARCDEMFLCAGQELWWIQLRPPAAL